MKRKFSGFFIVFMISILFTCAALAGTTAPYSLQENSTESVRSGGKEEAFPKKRLYRGVSVTNNWVYQARFNGIMVRLQLFERSGNGISFQENLKTAYKRFPRLEERSRQAAGTLSGGEQQMLAVARALIGMPKLLILDEPSLGLAPNIVDDILQVATDMARKDNISVLLVEQDITKALACADRGYVIENGRIALEGSSAELSANEHVKKAYLGI